MKAKGGERLLNSRLIIVEGIPGSGKTTTAKFLESQLQQDGLNPKLFQEGNLDHPADYEAVACFSQQEYVQFLAEHQKQEAFIRSITIKEQQDYFVRYRAAYLQDKEGFADELLHRFEAHDVYNLPQERYQEVILNKWKAFMEQVEENDFYIFECCFLQNPISTMLARDNAPRNKIKEMIKQIAAIIAPLNPIIIYYQQSDIKQTLQRVIDKRSEQWINFFTWYCAEQEFGKAHHVSGIDAIHTFLEIRKEIELEVLEEIPLKSYVINNSNYNWDKAYEQISKLVEKEIIK